MHHELNSQDHNLKYPAHLDQETIGKKAELALTWGTLTHEELSYDCLTFKDSLHDISSEGVVWDKYPAPQPNILYRYP